MTSGDPRFIAHHGLLSRKISFNAHASLMPERFDHRQAFGM